MLEDHSPTSRSSSRRPFRRKGAKTVMFNNSCTYYQLDSTSYDTSDGEEEDDDGPDPVNDAQVDDLDQQSSEVDSQARIGKFEAVSRQTDDLSEMEALMDAEVDAPLSPRIGIETIDVSGSFPNGFLPFLPILQITRGAKLCA
jgi:hypothetical protein